MMQLFLILLIAGLMLIGAEVFIPGGVLGTFGGFALLGAIITAFFVFPPSIAVYIAGAIILLVGFVILLWIKFFPSTWVGRQMTVSQDLHASKGTEDALQELQGATGVTLSALHPAGFAEINGRRVDVVTQGEMIDRDQNVRVVEVEANRVVVARVDA
jgi:membrane-bound serine protease (ClpP class)